MDARASWRVGHHRLTSAAMCLGRAEAVPGGLLGADYEVENGRYRFKKVYGGLNWTPRAARAADRAGRRTSRPASTCSPSNGQDLQADRRISTACSRTPPARSSRSRSARTPTARGSRTVQVVPIADESTLRNRDWVEGNLRKVDEATNGRVAYVYVPNTADAGPRLLQALLLPAGRQGRDHRRRALQRRRPGRRLLHRHPAPAARQLLGDALRRGPEDAARRRSRARR